MTQRFLFKFMLFYGVVLLLCVLLSMHFWCYESGLRPQGPVGLSSSEILPTLKYIFF